MQYQKLSEKTQQYHQHHSLAGQEACLWLYCASPALFLQVAPCQCRDRNTWKSHMQESRTLQQSLSAWPQHVHPVMFSNAHASEMDELLPTVFQPYPNPMTWGSLKKEKKEKKTVLNNTRDSSILCLQNCSIHPYQGTQLICWQQKLQNAVKQSRLAPDSLSMLHQLSRSNSNYSTSFLERPCTPWQCESRSLLLKCSHL